MVEVPYSGFNLSLYINILSLKFNCLGYGLRLRNNDSFEDIFKVKN